VPLFYNVDEDGISHGWVKVMKETIRVTGPNFSARRMAKEYTEKFYRRAIDAAIRAEKGDAKKDLFGRI
jgi:glycogen phosphorylase